MYYYYYYATGWITSKFQLSPGSFGNEFSAPSLSTQNISEDNNNNLLSVFQKTVTVQVAQTRQILPIYNVSL